MSDLTIFKKFILKFILPNYPWIKSVEVGSTCINDFLGSSIMVKYNYVKPTKVTGQKRPGSEEYNCLLDVQDETRTLLKLLDFSDDPIIKNFDWNLVNH